MCGMRCPAFSQARCEALSCQTAIRRLRLVSPSCLTAVTQWRLEVLSYRCVARRASFGVPGWLLHRLLSDSYQTAATGGETGGAQAPMFGSPSAFRSSRAAAASRSITLHSAASGRKLRGTQSSNLSVIELPFPASMQIAPPGTLLPAAGI